MTTGARVPSDGLAFMGLPRTEQGGLGGQVGEKRKQRDEVKVEPKGEGNPDSAGSLAKAALSTAQQASRRPQSTPSIAACASRRVA